MHDLWQEGGHQEQLCAEGLSPFNPYWAWIHSFSLLISHGKKHSPDGQSLKERHPAPLHMILLAVVVHSSLAGCSSSPSPNCPCLATLESRSRGFLIQPGGQRSFPIRFHLQAHLQLSQNCPLLSQLKPSFCRQKAIYCQINNAAACRAGSGQHRDMELQVRIITGVYHISEGYYIKGMLPCMKTAAWI